MRRLSIAFLVGILTLLLAWPGAAAAAGQTHTVQYGETLTSIAAQYGVSVDALARANAIASPNLIFVGEVLTIPGSGGTAAPSAPSTGGSYGNTYVVQPGDNLSSIAAQYGVSVSALAGANGLTDTNFIWSGQRLTVPGKASAPAPAAPPPAAPAQPASGSSYVVQAGDNLSTIASRYGVSADALAKANGITNPNLLFSGQKLTIPGRGASQAPPSQPTQSPPAAPPPAQAPPPARPTAAPPPHPPAEAPTPTTVPAAPPKTAPTPPPDKAKIVPAVGTVVKYTVQPGDVLYSIAARYNTTVDAIMARNHLTNANVITSGQTLEILVGDKVSKPANPPQAAPPTTAPNPPPDKSAPVIDKGNGGKWIDVNISTQTLTAYEGSTPVFKTLVSTGVSWHPTVVGTYHIYAKYLADDMSGGTGAEYYYLPNVPYTMYFYGGYAIHGTYWHHNFGHPMSHGCVNLPTDAAKWVYNWAPMGTTVVTHW